MPTRHPKVPPRLESSFALGKRFSLRFIGRMALPHIRRFRVSVFSIPNARPFTWMVGTIWHIHQCLFNCCNRWRRHAGISQAG